MVCMWFVCGNYKSVNKKRHVNILIFLPKYTVGGYNGGSAWTFIVNSFDVKLPCPDGILHSFGNSQIGPCSHKVLLCIWMKREITETLY